MPDQSRNIEMGVHGPETARGLALRVWPCYREVFGDFADMDGWRRDLFERHLGRDGYRLVVARDASKVTGFSWGYIGQRGQYWSDLVCEALPRSVTDVWIGGHFEFVELAVLPEYRRQGLGRRLHDVLLDGVDRRCLLSTNDDRRDPAVQLYVSRGWHKLGQLRMGVQVMGKDARCEERVAGITAHDG